MVFVRGAPLASCLATSVRFVALTAPRGIQLVRARELCSAVRRHSLGSVPTMPLCQSPQCSWDVATAATTAALRQRRCRGLSIAVAAPLRSRADKRLRPRHDGASQQQLPPTGAAAGAGDGAERRLIQRAARGRPPGCRACPRRRPPLVARVGEPRCCRIAATCRLPARTPRRLARRAVAHFGPPCRAPPCRSNPGHCHRRMAVQAQPVRPAANRSP